MLVLEVIVIRMPKRSKLIACRHCGSKFEKLDDKYILKTWHRVAPMPDKHGNLTISIMATWICPKCGKHFRKTMKISGPQTPQDQAQGTGVKPRSKKIELKASEVERKILICLKQSSIGLTPSQIAELTGLNVASIRTYLVRLRKNGLVKRKKWGWYEITDEGYEYLHELVVIE